MKQLTESEARVWLAELQGWKRAGILNGRPHGYPPTDSTLITGDIQNLPDYFTDANDDFALRDWMHKQQWFLDQGEMYSDAVMRLDFVIEQYETGDIARAVLAAHLIEVKEDE